MELVGAEVFDKLVYLSASVLPSSAANSVHVMKMSDALASRGIGVMLVGLDGDRKSISEQALRRAYGVSDGFSICRVPQRSLVGYRLRYALGILAGGWVPSGALIYTRVPKIAALAARLGRHCVLELHHPPSAGNTSAVERHLRSPTGGTIVVITDTLKEWAVRSLPVSSDRVIVAPDGADPFPEGVVPALPPSERCRVGYLGHLYPGKGIEVITQLAPRLPEVEFVVVGGTDEDIRRWQAQTNDYANLKFVGRVPHAETPAWLQSFDIALLPNQVQVGTAGGSMDIGRWTSPLKAFEYMSAGLAIVASDLENLREVFTDGENAILCAPEAVEHWEVAIRRLTADPALRDRLGRNAKRIFEAQYTWVARAQNICRQLNLSV